MAVRGTAMSFHVISLRCYVTAMPHCHRRPRCFKRFHGLSRCFGRFSWHCHGLSRHRLPCQCQAPIYTAMMADCHCRAIALSWDPVAPPWALPYCHQTDMAASCDFPQHCRGIASTPWDPLWNNSMAMPWALMARPWLCHGLSWTFMALPWYFHGIAMGQPWVTVSPWQCPESPW